MHSSKLIMILQHFDPAKFKELGKFVKSPYFNTKKKFIELYSYLSKVHPKLHKNQPQIAKEIVWKKLFPQKKFSAKKMTDLMSDMVILVQNFMAVHAFCQEKKLVNVATVLAFKQNKLFDFFETEVKKTEAFLIDDKQSLPFDQLLLFWLKKERYYHPLNSKAPPAGDLLLEANNYLDNFFLIYKLRLVLETQLRSRVYAKEEVLQVGQLNKTFQIDKHENKLVKTYYNLILLQQGNDFQ